MKVRYCKYCGTLGDIPSKYLSCCPDGGKALMYEETEALKMKEQFYDDLNDFMITLEENDD